MTECSFPWFHLQPLHKTVRDDQIDTEMADVGVERPVSPPQSVKLPDAQCLAESFTTNSAPSQSLFFTRLPGELRAQIYRHAFGNSTFHMDFRFTGPTFISTEKPYHAGIKRNAKGFRWPSLVEPQEWRWWGSVCHRDPSMPFWIDTCHDGVGACAWAPGLPAVPGICHVGVMGWITSCRQA